MAIPLSHRQAGSSTTKRNTQKPIQKHDTLQAFTTTPTPSIFPKRTKSKSLSQQKTLTEQATEANLITQSFLDQVNTQRAQLNGQRSHYQSLLNDLEGQNMKGSSAKKQKSLTLDAYRDAIRQIDQARSQLEEEVSKQLALLSSALNEKKLQIESDFSKAFVQLEQEFTKTYAALATEEQKALPKPLPSH